MIIDLHCDTIQKAKDEKLELNSKQLDFNLKDVQKYLPYIQCLATFVNPKYNEKDNGFKRAISIIDNFYMQYKLNKEKIYIIKNKEDFNVENFKEKLGVILTIENGSAISSKIENVAKLYNKGIRMMGITWNNDNELGCGAKTLNDIGLTNLGIEYVKKLEEKNILIDISHSSVKSFYDTIKNTTVPIIASHSCAKKVCNHIRNLDDSQIKEIANRKGVIGICFCKTFLTENEKASVNDIVRHIDYIVDLVGIDYVAIGTDFDGVEEEHKLEDIRGIKDIEVLVQELIRCGYKDDEIEKITSQNFLRVAKQII